MKTAVFALLIGVAGLYAGIALAGNVLVVRNPASQCVAIDAERGKPLGTFAMRDGRCWLQDWRIWHPWGAF